MAKQRYMMVHGMGEDAVGLVGKITSPVAGVGGNILDLRQDVLHGLFTIYLVLDMAASDLDDEGLRRLIDGIGEDTGLALSVSPYAPKARGADKKNLLMILMGRDRPGIIGASSEMLGKYNANIEFAQTIAREGIFLMELLTDISHVAIPAENLERAVSKNMEALNIKTVFQEDHVFNKRKRVILFHVADSFFDAPTRAALMDEAGWTDADLAGMEPGRAAGLLDGLSFDVMDAILAAIAPTPGSLELIQTLKTMGYKIALVSGGLSFLTDHLASLLDLDYAFGACHPVDDDARTLVGEIRTDEPGSHDVDGVLRHIMARERITEDDLSIITDQGCESTPGLRLRFDLERLLHYLNQRILTREQILGLLGGFGTPGVGG